MASLKNIREVFTAFLVLGVSAFGGPVAHLGYFRNEFVHRRRWLDEETYADLVALCQFLPGPASSQVGFAIGLLRGGGWGAAAAWFAFTLPSALLMVFFALGASFLDSAWGEGLVHGLKVVAVAVVAQAVWGMAGRLCPDGRRGGIALGALLIALFAGGPWGPVSAIAVGALAGLALCRSPADNGIAHVTLPVSRAVAWCALLLFFLLLLGLPVFNVDGQAGYLAMIDVFYRAGALVFGGGHVVLPLLQAEVVQTGWLNADEFLAGYGAAQAIPGPLFTFSAYLGAVLQPGDDGWLGALTALLAIFLPGFLLLIAVLPFWNRLRGFVTARAVLSGANAAVVGILGAALYDPLWTSTITGTWEFALAVVAFLLLVKWRVPAWAVVFVTAAGGMVAMYFSP